MIIETDARTRANWYILRRAIKDIQFSHNLPLFSLDESVGIKQISGRGMYAPHDGDYVISATVLVDIIGVETLKALVENTWNPTCYSMKIGRITEKHEITSLLNTFLWESTPQGELFWRDIFTKLHHYVRTH